MDEWAWAIMQGKVPPHGKVKTIMDKEVDARTEDEKKELENVLEAASKGRDARQSKKSVAAWKKEMSKDSGAFCTVMRDTERLVMKCLQGACAGEALNIVVGPQGLPRGR